RDSVFAEAVREVDRQPVGSALSQGLTVGKFEGRPADRIRLWVHQLWYRISASPVVHLMRIVESRVFAELFSHGQAGDDDVPGAFILLLLQSEKRTFGIPAFPHVAMNGLIDAERRILHRID